MSNFSKNLGFGKNSHDNSAASRDSRGSMVDDIVDLGDISWREPIRKRPKIQGKYLRGDLLGQGTFAKVYEVLDIISLERRAVKIFDMDKVEKKFNHEEIRKSIESEISILRQCTHPNVIQLVDVYREYFPIYFSPTSKIVPPKPKKRKNKIWMFLEYCMASVMEVILGNSPSRLPKYQAHTYFCDLIEAVDYLHSQGIYHKDIKPDNMLITKENTVKLTDLGVAHVTSLFERKDTCYNAFGTALYQSPEVLVGDTDGFSASALDVWSTGVVLFFMVTGRYPFYAESYVELAEKIQMEHFKRHVIVMKDAILYSILFKILRKDPAKRATVAKIKNHPFFNCRYPDNEPMAKIPPRYSYGDEYRSLTITAYLHELHYPLDPTENIVEVCESRANEFTNKTRIAILRSNRLRPKRRYNRRGSFHVMWETGHRRFFGAVGLKIRKRRRKFSRHLQ